MPVAETSRLLGDDQQTTSVVSDIFLVRIYIISADLTKMVVVEDKGSFSEDDLFHIPLDLGNHDFGLRFSSAASQ